MQQLALRRRRRFASREAALASFAGKPPFSSFQPDVLRAYVFHGLRDAPGPPAIVIHGEPVCVCGKIWVGLQVQQNDRPWQPGGERAAVSRVHNYGRDNMYTARASRALYLFQGVEIGKGTMPNA